MDELFQYLETLHPLSDELKAALVGRLHKETYRRNRPLLSIGQTCDWLAFIERGLAKLCYDIPGGRERIVCFLRPGEVACSISSFQDQQPSRFSIVPLDETVIRKLRKSEADSIASRHPNFHFHLRRITEVQAKHLELHYLLNTEHAKDRLSKLPELCGWMLKDKRIKQYMIADYLGIDHGTMSRWSSEQ